MASIKVAFFDAKPHDRTFFEAANQQHHFQLHLLEERLNVTTCSLAKGCDAICIFVNDLVTKEIVDLLARQNVKLIALRSTGYDHVDLMAAKQKLTVVRVPEYSPYAVAEFAVAMMLTLNRRLLEAHHRIHQHNFNIEGLLGFDMHGKTAGIIGAGRIGKALIQILKGFGMHVLAYDIDKKQVALAGCSFAELDFLYQNSDIISLHCPLTEQNKHMIDHRAFSKMKKNAMLINTGRGALIHTQDLITALESGKLSAAGLDVYENEKPYNYRDFSQGNLDDPLLLKLLSMPNVLLTSHQAFFTKEAAEEIATTTLSNIADFFAQKSLKNQL